MRFVYFLLVLLSNVFAAAQDSTSWPLIDTTKFHRRNEQGTSLIRPDSSGVQPRAFDSATLKDLRLDEDFDYKQPPSVAESLWDRLLLWFDRLLEWMLRTAVSTDWGQVFMYTLGLVVLIVVVMMLLKVDALRVFYAGADKGSLNYNAFHENIHEMDFEKLMQDALDNKEYRHGVRLTFLYALKLLSDKHYVDWRPGKTNHDYLSELKEGVVRTGFNELSFYFDYAWYGEFTVTQTHYQRVQAIFEDWRKKME